MCLAVPAEIVELKDNGTALVSIGGVEKDVSLQLLENVNKGDFILLHAGFAIQKIDEKEARETLKILKQMAEAL